MSDLVSYVNSRVAVITADGRFLVGGLMGSDQATNLVLSDCEERIFSMSEPTEIVPLGLYLVRGDNVVVVGQIDEEIDSEIDLNQIRAEPVLSVVH
ncbi:U4/U6-U5 snRNP complex subunit lsm8 [Entomophthora muscae]|uniref:U4/U6-U5 snRNP complex subunit lsm8 n=1 Tax=Entomophthora muscae TaxID=34485 RepID=A0ACC2U150_9FUNG|nr:U4/U6-U5 snRNP complex subunit lsm8 [Entomophthora muscae]